MNGAFRAGPEQPLQAEHADSPTHTPKDVLSRTGSSDQLAQPGSQMASTEVSVYLGASHDF